MSIFRRAIMALTSASIDRFAGVGEQFDGDASSRSASGLVDAIDLRRSPRGRRCRGRGDRLAVPRSAGDERPSFDIDPDIARWCPRRVGKRIVAQLASKSRPAQRASPTRRWRETRAFETQRSENVHEAWGTGAMAVAVACSLADPPRRRKVGRARQIGAPKSPSDRR
jgi:hypothetical protein